MSGLFRRRPRNPRTHALGQHSRRRRRRHPDQAGWRRRGRSARRPAGDLYIFLALAPHPFFQRDGADLHCRVPISMVQAALGSDIEVPTIDGGKTRVKVPEGSQSGRRFRLQGKGMPVLRSRRSGDITFKSWSRRRRS
jgi:DnaJ-class molecular chaperone